MMSINRRGFLFELVGFFLCNIIAGSMGKSHDAAKQKQEKEPYDMQLRPHHILDIISDYGHGIQYQPHPYGHSLHVVTPKLLSNLDLKIKLTLNADDICKGCVHLMSDGKCNDVLAQLKPSPSKQAYNDVLDCRLFDYLDIEVDSVMTLHSYLELVNEKVPGIEKICTHPKENEEERLNGLIKGLIKSGIRK